MVTVKKYVPSWTRLRRYRTIRGSFALPAHAHRSAPDNLGSDTRSPGCASLTRATVVRRVPGEATPSVARTRPKAAPGVRATSEEPRVRFAYPGYGTPGRQALTCAAGERKSAR